MSISTRHYRGTGEVTHRGSSFGRARYDIVATHNTESDLFDAKGTLVFSGPDAWRGPASLYGADDPAVLQLEDGQQWHFVGERPDGDTLYVLGDDSPLKV